ncbi:pectin lyase fold/virulence factor [Zychaea mexicana]|uniref:pectin lyase fold/virulence factor n=1 Tax=Zychaea mexicana TaxID=64656 RepID=UPI0022FDBC65|nr:pectin lyase fold/virulence factor [Zychaea mexicana]KAI9498417.1 pectin lyase fold/virulence factor [Zychaea mexicana]
MKLFHITAGIALLFASAPAFAAPARRATTCTIESTGGGDDTPNIVKAFTNCNNGGTVKFPKDAEYNMETVIYIEDLQDITVDFQGTLNLPKYNTKYEDEKAFIYLRGDNIHFSGPGTINGNGQGWYDAVNRKAPPLFKPRASNSYFGGFSIVKAPRSHFSVNNCENVVFEHLNINTVSDDEEKDAHNTDAFDVSDSTGVVIQSSTIVNGDDCIAVNGGAKNLTVTNLDCTGSHGFSVGSLGKDSSETDEVSDLKFISNACHDCQNGVRIKTWPGGKGSVTGIVFDDINLDNVDNPIIITTHYCDNNQMEYCTGQDSHSLTISDVTINNIYGSASEHKYPVLSVDCSTDTPCKDFTITNINVEPSSKTTDNVCVNLNGSDDISYCN